MEEGDIQVGGAGCGLLAANLKERRDAVVDGGATPIHIMWSTPITTPTKRKRQRQRDKCLTELGHIVKSLLMRIRVVVVAVVGPRVQITYVYYLIIKQC